MRATLVVLACASLIVGGRRLTSAQTQRLEYRVVFASARQLARQLDEAGRDGYACATVARSEPGAGEPGIVVLLGRAVGGPTPAVAHRVIVGGGGGVDLQAPLDRADAEGFRLCGVVLDEEPPNLVLVAVMSQRADAAKSTVRYARGRHVSRRGSAIELGRRRPSARVE